MNKFLEKFWLFVAITATVVTLYLFATDGVDAGKYYLLLTGMVWGMYLIRRGLRIRLEKIEASKKEENNVKN